MSSAGRVTRDGSQTRVSPPDELLKGLLGERATGCWELELNGLGKSETRGGREIIQRSCPQTCVFSPTNKTILD